MAAEINWFELRGRLEEAGEKNVFHLSYAEILQHFTFALPEGGTRALHVSCPWRLAGTAGLLVGSGDYWRPATTDTPDEEFDRGVVGARLRDVRNAEVRALLGEGVEVLAAEADTFGGLELRLAGGLTLEVFPDASHAEHDELEFWRVFEPGGPHVVVRSDGLDYVADV
jgi:hypothetical protein